MKALLIAYDNGSYIHQFPHGLAYIASILEREGYEVEIYHQNKFHYPEEHLTQYLNQNQFDVVGLGFIAGYYEYRKVLKIAKAIDAVQNKPFFILGGHGPSPEPAYFLKKMKADVVVIGEGEETIKELFWALEKKRAIQDIKGIACWKNGEVIINERRPLVENIDLIPMPAFHLFPIDYYRLLRLEHVKKNDFVMPVLSGRGCAFKCNFCYRMDEGFRPRSTESIIEEIEFLKQNYDIRYINFSDELLMSARARTIDLCEAFIKAKVNVKWRCNGRLNYAIPDVLNVMEKSGCVFINYGIEAMDDTVLKNMSKCLTVKQIEQGIANTLEAGISPGFNILFGNIGDNKETLRKGVDFLLKYDDGAQMRTIRPVTPYPGSPLYYHAIEKGLLKGCEDFYENKHLNSDLLAVNFTSLSDDEFHEALLEANTMLLNNYFAKKSKTVIAEAQSLYLEKNIGFRGFRQS